MFSVTFIIVHIIILLVLCKGNKNYQSVLFNYRCMRLFSFHFYKCCHLMFKIKTNRNFAENIPQLFLILLQTKCIRWRECLRTTEPSFRTYEPSDYRTFGTESCQCRCRIYEPSDWRTFGMKNLLFRTYEPSDYRTFGLKSSHR